MSDDNAENPTIGDMLNASRGQQWDQMETALREQGKLLLMHQRMFMAAGWTDGQAFLMTMQFHRVLSERIVASGK